ncbi:MAG: threonine/serine exporter family protein [Succinivibrionaceae bacterium]
MELLDLLIKSAFAIIPAVGFAILFSVPKKLLLYVSLGGYVCYFFRRFSMAYLDCGFISSAFIASIIVSLLFIYIGPKLKVPRPVFTVASIIPIIPGKFAYMTLISLIQFYQSELQSSQYIVDFFYFGIMSSGIIVAIGLGIALPPLFFYRNRPVV